MNGLFLSQSTLNRKKNLHLLDFPSNFVHLLLTEKRKIKAQSLKNAFLQKEAF